VIRKPVLECVGMDMPLSGWIMSRFIIVHLTIREKKMTDPTFSQHMGENY
jgi:hypothetical protein